MTTRLGRTCERIVEAGWLLALFATPAFFNIYTSRVFEPDKMVLLRAIVTVMAAAAAVKGVEWILYALARRVGLMPRPEIDLRLNGSPDQAPAIRGILMGSAVLLALAYLLATLFSVAPRFSLLGSYQRVQGTYASLCLIILALLMAALLRTRAQVGRLIGAVLLGSLPVAVYGIAQHYGADPFPWSAETKARVTSTLGNSIFLGAYLIMVIPLTMAGAVGLARATVSTVRDMVRLKDRLFTFRAGARLAGLALLCLGCLVLLALQGATLYFTHARGPRLGLLAGLVAFALLLVLALLGNMLRKPPRIVMGVMFVILVGLVGASAWLSFTGFPNEQFLPPVSDRDTQGQTRPLIWQGARELIRAHPSPGIQPDGRSPLRPFFGYGPETMMLTFPKVYPPQLARYEDYPALPDRALNGWLDLGVGLGWVGVGVYLLLLVAFLAVGLWTLARAKDPVVQVVLVGLMAAGVAHYVEGLFGIDIAATRLIFWICVGAVAALTAFVLSPKRDKPSPARAKPGAEALAEPASWSGLAATLSLAWLLGAVLVLMMVTLAREQRSLVLSGVAGGLWLAGALGTGVLFQVDRWLRSPRPAWWRWAYPIAIGALTLYALLLLALVMANLVATVGSGAGQPILKGTEVSVNARFFAIFGWLGLALFGVAFALRRERTPFVAWSWRNLVAFLVASPVYALLWGAALGLILITNLLPVRADALHKQAGFYEAGRSWEEAVDLYQEAIATVPGEDFYYIALGRTYLERAKQTSSPAGRDRSLARAQETLEEAYALSPLNPDHPTNLARLHYTWASLDPKERQQHLDQALDYYEQATVIAPFNVKTLSELGSTYWTMGKLEEAEEVYVQALELDEAFSPAHSSLANIYAQRGELDRALAEAKTALGMASEDEKAPLQEFISQIYMSQAEEFLQQGELDRAEEVLLQLLALDPNNVKAHSSLGFIYARRGQLDQAIAENLEVLKLVPDDYDSHKNLALLYRQTGRLAEALTSARTAMLLAPAQDQGKWEQFIAELEAQVE